MAKLILFSLSIFVSSLAFGKSHPNLDQFHQLFEGEARLYAGFGLARDMLAHVYEGKTFAPRDYDFAVVGAKWSEAEAEAKLAEYGVIRKRVDMFKEVLKPNGRVFSCYYGYVLILDVNGQQLDFNFFQNIEDAHLRGIYDVERILFPMNDRSIMELVSDIKQIRNEGRLPGPGEVSDPHNGIKAFLEGNPSTVNWAKAKASPLEWIVRGAMIKAKMGDSPFSAEELRFMKEALPSVRYIGDKVNALVGRAIHHKRWWKVRSHLSEIGFFDYFPTWG